MGVSVSASARRRRRWFPSPSPSAPAAKGGRNPGSGGWLVYRWCTVVGDGVCVGAAASGVAVLSPRIWPLLVGASGGDDGSVGVLPRGWRGGDAVFAWWRFRPQACCRRAGVSSSDGAELLRYVWRFFDGADGAAAEDELRMVLEGSGLLSPGQELRGFGARRRPICFSVYDPVRRGWWLLRSVVAFWLGVLPAPRFVVVDGAVQLRWRVVDEDVLQGVFHLYPWLFLYVCVSIFCILTTL